MPLQPLDTICKPFTHSNLSHRYWSLLTLLTSLLISLIACESERPKEDQERAHHSTELTPSQPAHLDTSPSLNTLNQRVIYGEDTRKDVYELERDDLRARAQSSIFAMINADSVDESDPDDIRMISAPIGTSYDLCEGERYFNQPTAASCSMTLIEDDLLVTAGHCIESQQACERQVFVLGYEMDGPDTLAPITADQLYRCRRLVLSVNNNSLDFAFIQLDRPVSPLLAEPAPINLDPLPLPEGESLVMMGFPSGLPLKVDDGGRVSDPREGELDFFKATVDAFGGNSGSSVYNSRGEQVGILVRGEQDYIPQNGECNVVNRLNEDRGIGDDAEEITYFFQAVDQLCETGYASERLCQVRGSGICDTCTLDEDCINNFVCGAFMNLPNAPRFCAPRCDSTDLCPSAHECVAGVCTPTLRRSCEAEESIWLIDGCNREISALERCQTGTYCQNGACLLSGRSDRCEEATPIEITSQSLQGDLSAGYSNTRRYSCAGVGPERFYRFELRYPNRIIATASGFDTVLALSRTCDTDDEVSCNDDNRPPGRLGSRIEVELSPGPYVLAMDSYSNQGLGEYVLEIDLCNEVCAPNTTRCDESGVVLTCVQDLNGCYNWATPRRCEVGLVCDDGLCIRPMVTEACEVASEIDVVDQTLMSDSPGVYTSQFEPACLLDQRPDRLYRFTLESEIELNATSEGAVDALSLWAGCDPQGTDLLCAPQRINTSAQLTASLASGAYTLVVSAEEERPWSVDLTWRSPCEDECAINATPRCAQDGGDLVEACEVTQSGCAEWVERLRCDPQATCVAGECISECFHQCDPDQSSCLNMETPIVCDLDERGCRVWVELDDCPAATTCVDEGECAPLDVDSGLDGSLDEGLLDAGLDAGGDRGVEEDEGSSIITLPSDWVGYEGPEDVLIPERALGGCDQSTEIDAPPILLLLIIALMRLLSPLNRRRARARLRPDPSLRSTLIDPPPQPLCLSFMILIISLSIACEGDPSSSSSEAPQDEEGGVDSGMSGGSQGGEDVRAGAEERPNGGTRIEPPEDGMTLGEVDGDPLTLRIKQGLIRGAQSDEVRAFKGVPYAAPPVGALRFRAPRVHPEWTDVRETLNFGVACPQPTQLGIDVNAQGEDCLTLNVWAPPRSNEANNPDEEEPTRERPVMLWIHGGGFSQGGSAQTLYQGARLAAGGEVVVVSINYRLGALGFLAAESLAEEDPSGAVGNYGVLDQIFALQWVQENISAFGGDPTRVTVFGESAGGFSICALLASPLAEGLFHQAIIQSGGGCDQFPLARESSALGSPSRISDSLPMIEFLGCADVLDIPECLRRASVDQLVAATESTADALFGLPQVGPNIDGVVIAGQAVDRLESGASPDVPILTGSNADEMSLFTIGQTWDIERYEQTVRSLLPLFADDLLALYPAPTDEEAKLQYIAMTSDIVFICPALSFARATSGGSAPTFSYHFTHTLSSGLPATLGSTHAIEIAFVFNNTHIEFFGATATEEDRALGLTLSNAWARFAYTGRPELPIEWPPYRSATSEGTGVTALLAPELSLSTSLREGRCDALAELGLVDAP
jgi:para-nitrobenzyl esterase